MKIHENKTRNSLSDPGNRKTVNGNLIFSGSNCLLPLGMGKGHIKDEDISASSAFDLKSVGPHLARLDMDLNGGAWCPKKVIEPGVREWIEIDLQRPYRISRTATQGRYGGGQGQEYAEEFLLEYWRPSLKEWKTYRQVTT